MKRIFTGLAIFVISVFVFSGLSGCGGPSGSMGSTSGNSAASNPATNTAPAKNSVYPPLAEKVAQADVKNLDGSTFKVADRKGKVLLLNMWATWCGPCRQEMPALVRMQDAHGDAGFEVIGLNTDDGDTKEMIDKFAADMKLNYTLVWADTAMQNEMLKISRFAGIPQSFIIDRDGRLRGVFKGANPRDIKIMEELVARVVNGEDTTMPAGDEPAANTTATAEESGIEKTASKK
jgi:thiol-disulfide isomerase/thioredoxin